MLQRLFHSYPQFLLSVMCHEASCRSTRMLCPQRTSWSPEEKCILGIRGGTRTAIIPEINYTPCPKSTGSSNDFLNLILVQAQNCNFEELLSNHSATWKQNKQTFSGSYTRMFCQPFVQFCNCYNSMSSAQFRVSKENVTF